MKKTFLSLCAGLIALGTSAQIQAPAPSPSAKVEQKVGLTDVTIEYSRPSVKDREIFGNLVPYGEIWRTGANENSKITFSDDVMVDGKKLEKGTYALYTIPNKDSWDVIFYSDASNWGTPQKWDDSKVAVKASGKVLELPFKIESFMIMVGNLQNEGAELHIGWENQMVTVPFSVPSDTQTMASIEKVMNGPSANDYFAAGTYYFNAGKDLKKAHEWVSKATTMKSDAFWMWRQKSLIEAKMGMKKEAVASAKKSLSLAEQAGNQDYVKMNKDSLKEWGAM